MNLSLYRLLKSALVLLPFIGGLSLQAQTSAIINIKNESEINTPELEFSPTFYENGIVFISTNSAGLKKAKDERIKFSTMSILEARRNAEGVLATAMPFSKNLSTAYHEGPVCFDVAVENIFYSSNAFDKSKAIKAKDGEQKMRLYTAKRTGEAWETPQPLPINEGEWDDCHPSISIDSKRLIFASDRPGGQGGMDLYVTYKTGDTWSEPINLGPGINTSANEVFPFLHADNSLFFASDKAGGKGGFDIYYAVQQDAEYKNPSNIGAPFNTPGDDFGLIIDLDKKNGYFSSNGNGGNGGDDIYSFGVANGNFDNWLSENNLLPSVPTDLLLSVFDPTGKPISGADIKVFRLTQGDVIGVDEQGNNITLQNVNGNDVLSVLPKENALTGLTDEAGRFMGKTSTGNYVFIVSKPGYQPKQVSKELLLRNNEFFVTLDYIGDKVQFNTVLVDETTGAPLSGAMLVLKNPTTGTLDTLYADENGKVNYFLDADVNYETSIYQNGKLVGTTTISTVGMTAGGSATMSAPVAAGEKLAAGTVIELPNIYYNYNDPQMRPDAAKDLAPLVALLKKHPGLTLEIASHTDSRGRTDYNNELSQRRANEVLAYLASKGVDKKKLVAKGYGESQLRNNCKDGVECGEKDHARNRRTEIRVLSGAEGAKVKNIDGKLGLGKTANPNKNNATVAAHGPNSEFFVIVGSFLMENRANTRLKEVIAQGYSNASIMQFPNSPYYSVCVEKFKQYEAAEALKNILNNKHKMEVYIRIESK